MAVTNVNLAGATAAIGKFNPLRDASAKSEKVAPVFSRPASVDAGKLPSLVSLGVEEGRTPSNSEVQRALTGDLLRILRDLRAGDLPKANAKLHEMKCTMPTNFLLQNRLDPGMIGFMGRDMLLAPDAKTALGLVLNRLGKSNISTWHPEFRAPALHNEG